MILVLLKTFPFENWAPDGDGAEQDYASSTCTLLVRYLRCRLRVGQARFDVVDTTNIRSVIVTTSVLSPQQPVQEVCRIENRAKNDIPPPQAIVRFGHRYLHLYVSPYDKPHANFQ